MRNGYLASTLILLSLVGCSGKAVTDSDPVDTTLPANTQAIGGVADAADLNQAANDAIAQVNAEQNMLVPDQSGDAAAAALDAQGDALSAAADNAAVDASTLPNLYVSDPSNPSNPQ